GGLRTDLTLNSQRRSFQQIASNRKRLKIFSMSSAGNSRSLFQDIGSRKFGDRGSRIRMMITDIVFWAETRSDEPVYVLVISKDKNLEEDAKFSTVRELLEKHRDFHLTVVKPDTVLSL
ncbi:unnamed protein product, partial [Brassica oleracea]